MPYADRSRPISFTSCRSARRCCRRQAWRCHRRRAAVARAARPVLRRAAARPVAVRRLAHGRVPVEAVHVRRGPFADRRRPRSTSATGQQRSACRPGARPSSHAHAGDRPARGAPGRRGRPVMVDRTGVPALTVLATVPAQVAHLRVGRRAVGPQQPVATRRRANPRRPPSAVPPRCVRSAVPQVAEPSASRRSLPPGSGKHGSMTVPSARSPSRPPNELAHRTRRHCPNRAVPAVHGATAAREPVRLQAGPAPVDVPRASWTRRLPPKSSARRASNARRATRNG